MNTPPSLQPTLWRTCRAIANRTRLRIFGLLLEQPGQTVSPVAMRLKQPLPLASEYLRMLEARGLLTARRVGRCVTDRPGPATVRLQDWSPLSNWRSKANLNRSRSSSSWPQRLARV